jgi:UDP-3-O-[3-hydroxymyristoyl] glucosamine N-acyltransferase
MKKMNDIGDNFQYGINFSIGSYNVIGNNVSLGDNVKIGHHCIIENNITIGNNVLIQGNVKIASGTTIKDNCTLKHGTILTNQVIIEENVFMGPNTITLGGHVNRKSEHGTVIGKNCYIGAATQIVANTKICDNVITGAFSFINKNIDVPGTYVGIPARRLP